MRTASAIAMISAMLLMLLPATALAGGAALPVRGVRALSIGGAHVAGAEEVNALWYNPSRLDGSAVMLELGVVSLDAQYTPQGEGNMTARNVGMPLPNPTIGGVWRINDMISVGLGAYAPYAGQARFAENGPQRYSLVASDQTTSLIINAGVAFRFNRFRIGAGLQNVMLNLKQRTVLSGYTGLFGTPDDPELDILNELDLNDPFTLTGNIGAGFDAGPVSLGVAVQLPYTVSGQADFRVRLPSSVFFDSMTVEGDQIYTEIPFPLMIRGGAQWRILPGWMVEVAVNYEGWSRQEALLLDPEGRIKIRGVPGIGDYDMGILTVDRRMKDTVSVHFGSAYRVIPSLALRAGFFYEPSAFGDETFSAAQFDDDKIGLAFGVSYHFSSFRFDLAVSRIFQGVRDVQNSELRQLNPTNPDQTEIVGNGLYQSNFWVGGLGVTWLID